MATTTLHGARKTLVLDVWWAPLAQLLLQFLVSKWFFFFFSVSVCVFKCSFLDIPLANLLHGYRWVLVARHRVVGCFWRGEGSATLVVCVCVCFYSVEEGRLLGQQVSGGDSVSWVARCRKGVRTAWGRGAGGVPGPWLSVRAPSPASGPGRSAARRTPGDRKKSFNYSPLFELWLL